MTKYVFSSGLNDKTRYLLQQLRNLFKELHGREPRSSTELFTWMLETLYGIATLHRNEFKKIHDELKKIGVIDIT